MFIKQRVRLIIYVFLLLITSTLLPAAFARPGITYSVKGPIAEQNLQNMAALQGKWIEMGSSSASGGGISDFSQGAPSLAIGPDGTAMVAWNHWVPAKNGWEIYVRRWDGTSWIEVGSSIAVQVGGNPVNPSLAIGTDGNPIIAWEDSLVHEGPRDIYVRRFNGISWTEMGSGSASGGGISNNSGNSLSPSLTTGHDGSPMVAWFDWTSGRYSEIYVRRFNGTSWIEVGSGSATGGGISNNSGDSYHPSLAISSNGDPIITWIDYSGGGRDVYVRRFNGTSWAEMGSNSASGRGISMNNGDSYHPSLAIGPDGTPIVAWSTGSGRREIYILRFNGTAWVEMGSNSASGGGISNNGGDSASPSLDISPVGIPIVAWEDDSTADLNYEIYVRSWNGTSWVEMGKGSATGGGISSNNEESVGPSLTIGPDGRPVVAWSDSGIYVLRWQADNLLFLPIVIDKK